MADRQHIALALAVSVAVSLAAGCIQRDPPAAPDDDGGTAAAAVPDFSGVWMAFAVESPDGSNQPVYSEQGQALLDAYAAQFRTIPEAGGNCVGAGYPGVMLSTVSYPIEMVQNESRILMVAELETQVRRIFIDGRDFPENVFPQMVGYSIGRFEGDTLVIETALLEPWELRPWMVNRKEG